MKTCSEFEIEEINSAGYIYSHYSKDKEKKSDTIHDIIIKMRKVHEYINNIFRDEGYYNLCIYVDYESCDMRHILSQVNVDKINNIYRIISNNKKSIYWEEYFLQWEQYIVILELVVELYKTYNLIDIKDNDINYMELFSLD